MPTASSSLYSANERGSSVASLTSATSPSRTMRPLRLRHDQLLEVGRRVEPALQPDRPLVELAFEPADRRRPGSATAAPARPARRSTPAACRSRGRISTTSSRSMPPTRFTCATPEMPRSRRVMSGIGHARQLGAGQPRRRQRQRDDRPIRRIELREDRLLHLGRQVVADRRDLVADLLRRLAAGPSRSRTRR